MCAQSNKNYVRESGVGEIPAKDALRESEDRLQHALEVSGFGIWALDLKTGQAWRSLRHDQIFGYEELRPAWTFEAFLEHVLPEERAQVAQGFRHAVETGSEWSFDCRIRRQDGAVRWIWAQGRPRLNDQGEVRQLVGLVRDITEQKQTEERLQRANEDLEQRVAERSAELVKLNRTLEQRVRQSKRLALELSQAEQRERRRVAAILHDHLQQLLVAAALRVGTLRRRVQDPTVLEGLDQIGQLINESVQESRALTVDLNPPVLFEAGLVAAVKWLALHKREQHGLQVEVQTEAEEFEIGDEMKVVLYQAVRELLFNAAKHSGEKDAKVVIERAAGEMLRITVSDQGVGCDLGVLEAKSVGGFGLYSVRERLRLMDGSLEVHTAPRAGMQVVILAPLRDQSDVKAGQAPVQSGEAPSSGEALAGAGGDSTEPPQGKRRIRVLLADDHSLLREGLASLLLEEPDVELVGQAADGEDAVTMALRLRPEVVLMDISMPRLDGIEATRRIKAKLPEVQVIGLSMYEASELSVQMLEAGAAAYVSKDGPAEDLIAAIRRSRPAVF